MIFLWSRSNKIGSKAICWGCNSDCSHFSIVFDESPSGYGIVFHSELLGGVQLDWFRGFQEKHQIVHALKPKRVLTVDEEEMIYQSIVSRFYGQEYDRMAFIFWTKAILKYKIFGTQIPSTNEMDDPKKELCTELGKGIADISWLEIPKIEDYAMIIPHAMYEIFSQSPMLERVAI